MLQEQFRILGFDGHTAGKSNKSKSRKSRYKELKEQKIII
jgi:hypothetical protein